MTAEEMFNNSGYIKIQDNDKGLFFETVDGEEFVKFVYETKNIYIGYNDECLSEITSVWVTSDLIGAIQKQIEELGWDK